jgi:hypothetical protein
VGRLRHVQVLLVHVRMEGGGEPRYLLDEWSPSPTRVVSFMPLLAGAEYAHLGGGVKCRCGGAQWAKEGLQVQAGGLEVRGRGVKKGPKRGCHEGLCVHAQQAPYVVAALCQRHSHLPACTP